MSTFRTPTPDDGYLSLLGRASYTWAYAEWAMIYVIHWLTHDDLAQHAGGTGGTIVAAFNAALDSPTPPPGVTADAWEQARHSRDDLAMANHRRNDIMHARPATTPDGNQRLDRWAPGRANVTAGVIEAADLADFIALVEHADAAISSLHEQMAEAAE